jgi:hypothetical protein
LLSRVDNEERKKSKRKKKKKKTLNAELWGRPVSVVVDFDDEII